MWGEVAKRGNAGQSSRLMWGDSLRDRLVADIRRGEENRLSLGVESLRVCLH